MTEGDEERIRLTDENRSGLTRLDQSCGVLLRDSRLARVN